MAGHDVKPAEHRDGQRELDRRRFLKSMGVAAVGGVLADLGLFDDMAAGTTRSAGSHARPNIIVLLVDELRFPSVFPAGVGTAEEFLQKFMPNVYELWKHGVKFANHHTAGNACSPSRATMVTGLYPHQQWILKTRTALSPALHPAFPTYGKLLRQLGYRTPYIGKWHLSNAPANGSTVGYLEQYGFAGMTNPDPVGLNGQGAADDPDIAGQAISWLQGQARTDEPYCLTVSFVNPHDKQYFWAGTEGDTFEALFSGKSLRPLKRDYMSVNGEDTPPPLGYPTLPPNWESVSDLRLHHKPSTHILARYFQELVWGGAPDAESTQFVVDPYPGRPDRLGIGVAPFSYWERGLDMYTHAMTLVDDQIGRVVASIPQDQLSNTVLMMFSDHGEFAGAHGLLSGKIGTAYDEAWHVPLIVADPSGRFTADTDVERHQLTSSADFMPMVVSIANGGSRSWMKGHLAEMYANRLDMVPLLRNPGAAGRPHLLFATDEIIPLAMNYLRAPTHLLGIQTPDAKLCTYSGWIPRTAVPAAAGMEIEFYDYSTAVGRAELENQAGDPRARTLMQQLFRRYVPGEFQAPLPTPALRRASDRARSAYLSALARSNALSEIELIDQRKIETVVDYGLNM